MTAQRLDDSVHELMQTYTSIRRGLHSGWKGDPVLNAETFLYRQHNNNPHFAYDAAVCLEHDSTLYSDALGIPPSRVLAAAKILRGELVP